MVLSLIRWREILGVEPKQVNHWHEWRIEASGLSERTGEIRKLQLGLILSNFKEG